MGRVAAILHATGYTTALLAPQSYLDAGAGETYRHFDLDVTHVPEWSSHARHGLQTYAPLLATNPEKFDLVIIELYEEHSRAWHVVDSCTNPPGIMGLSPCFEHDGRALGMSSYISMLGQLYSTGSQVDGAFPIDFGGAFGLASGTSVRFPQRHTALCLPSAFFMVTKIIFRLHHAPF
jgi:hypothetical protein|eukprot:COSAG02_NODE_2464_length_8789_cov_10.474502_3_plen_178_part_00